MLEPSNANDFSSIRLMYCKGIALVGSFQLVMLCFDKPIKNPTIYIYFLHTFGTEKVCGCVVLDICMCGPHYAPAGLMFGGKRFSTSRIADHECSVPLRPSSSTLIRVGSQRIDATVLNVMPCFCPHVYVFSTHNRLTEYEQEFGRDSTALGRMFRTATDLVYDAHADRIKNGLELFASSFPTFAQKIHDKGEFGDRRTPTEYSSGRVRDSSTTVMPETFYETVFRCLFTRWRPLPWCKLGGAHGCVSDTRLFLSGESTKM